MPRDLLSQPRDLLENPQPQAGQQGQDVPPIPEPVGMPQSATMPWSDVAQGAVRNIPESAVQFAKDTAYPVMHPIQTAKSLGNLALGAGEKIIPGEQEHEKYADAVGEFFANRYGGMENLKRTMAEDPVGFLADVGTLVSGGAAIAAKTPLAATRAGPVIEAIRHPLRTAGKGAAEVIGALGTHTGGQSLKTAARAGYKGGQAAEDFLGNMRGTLPMEDVVTDARRAVQTLRQRRGAAYRSGMGNLAQDTTVLDFAPIDRALAKSAKVKTYKGVPISKSTQKVSGQIDELVQTWKGLDPTDYHTPEGLDALKQAIGDVRDSTEYGTPSRLVADQAYQAVKDQIVKQAPDYAKTMKGYEEASNLIREMERTLSLNPKAAVDTQLRKLQSVMRNNAYTNYGRRLVLAELLTEAGAETLMEKLAGQQLSSIAPRGIGRLVAGGTAVGGAGIDPSLLLALPLQSPRLMGETAYYTGKAARAAPPPGTLPSVFQTGRVTNDQNGRNQPKARTRAR